MKKLYKINQFTAAEWDSIEYDWNEHEDEIVIIEKKDAYCMDITANGKRIVPILRKIEEAMTAAGLAGETGIYAGWFGEWANELTDRRDRKYFIWNYSGQSDRERGCWSYSWGIEQIDEDRWYIFLNIAKPQEETEETETEETEAETIEETAEEVKEVATMKKYFKVTFEYAEGIIYCTNLAHAETAEDVERKYSKYPWQSVKEAQPWDVEEAKMKGMPIIEVEAAPAEDPEADTDTDTEEEEEEQNMKPEVIFSRIREEVEARTERSAWSHGVTAYALELVDELEEATEGGYFDLSDLEAPKLVDRQLLNGAADWNSYSWGGCSLIYNGDIAERLCTPSELKRTRGGERRPNSREEWLDCQARALFQASNRVKRSIRAALEA